MFRLIRRNCKFTKWHVLRKAIRLFGSVIFFAGCNWFVAEEMVILGQEAYAIDSETILYQLGENNGDVFRLQPAGEMPLHAIVDFAWSETDFLIIADSLNLFVWGESLSSWSLHGLRFEFHCQDISDGPKLANLRFMIEEDGRRLVSDVWIRPLDNLTTVQKSRYEPLVFEWAVIDLNRIISATEAIGIAEANGGRLSREFAGNQCNVIAILSNSGGVYQGWQVFYETTAHEIIIEFNINKTTGAIEE